MRSNFLECVAKMKKENILLAKEELQEMINHLDGELLKRKDLDYVSPQEALQL